MKMMQNRDSDEILSVIIPTYNEELMIIKTYNKINGILEANKIPHNIVFIDDGSKDSTWEIIKGLSTDKTNIVGIRFSRNFGKEAAIYAGLSEASRSGCCVVIDCDLQHPPEKIVEMYHLWTDGYEVIEGVKSSRGKESIYNKAGAKIFYGLMTGAIKIDMQHASDFKLLDRKAVLAILNMREKNAFFRAISFWIGFKTIQVEFDVQEREIGSSKWSLLSLIKYAINNVTSFSSAPMQIVTFLGVVVFICSILLGINSLVQKFAGQALEGFTTVIGLQLFSSSVIMLSLGIIGYYISKIYDEVKDRPKYIISELCRGNEYDKETV